MYFSNQMQNIVSIFVVWVAQKFISLFLFFSKVCLKWIKLSVSENLLTKQVCVIFLYPMLEWAVCT